MDERLENLRSTKNPKARIKIMKGHFATSNSHLDTYIDMSTVKIRHNNAREAAKVLAQEYVTSTYVCCLPAVQPEMLQSHLSHPLRLERRSSVLLIL